MHNVDGFQIINEKDDLNTLDTNKLLRLVVRTTREMFERVFQDLKKMGWSKISDSGALHRPPELGGDCFSREMVFGKISKK